MGNNFQFMNVLDIHTYYLYLLDVLSLWLVINSRHDSPFSHKFCFSLIFLYIYILNLLKIHVSRKGLRTNHIGPTVERFQSLLKIVHFRSVYRCDCVAPTVSGLTYLLTYLLTASC